MKYVNHKYDVIDKYFISDGDIFWIVHTVLTH